MSIVATIMNSVTGQPIQKMTFGRLPSAGRPSSRQRDGFDMAMRTPMPHRSPFAQRPMRG
ncbi:hypothetical protein SxD43FB_19005 [Sphingobium sp. D43FB]|nr:hypothetical protein [Sphingobium psychrophilum]PBN41923.1 hypothetical protein SxD43FB_19005 [Sphingobium sp. D43FB]